ncbi:MAG: hypothetical protein LAP13_12725 [Acidobacteriia bacterium]|nr:hypothetical protein [Terriglobia bacterium]
MKRSLIIFLQALILVLAFAAGSLWNRRAVHAQADTAPVAYAFGHNLSVYYPVEKKLYVYTELGGNCVYSYSLGTPGGPIPRENCK